MNAVLNFEMGKAIRDLATLFGHKWDGGEAQVNGYLKALADLSVADVTSACDDLARTERFMPRPSVVRKRVDLLRRKATPIRPWAVPETMHDDAGKVVRAYRCRECLDTGWLTGFPLVQEGERGPECAAYMGARRCGCGRLSPPKARVFEGQGEQWKGER